MPSDLEYARRNWQLVQASLEQLERQCSEGPEPPPRRQAEHHVARLREFIARGRVMALERSCHAHLACENAPASYFWSKVSGRGQGGQAV
jgi:hypothetical protein